MKKLSDLPNITLTKKIDQTTPGDISQIDSTTAQEDKQAETIDLKLSLTKKEEWEMDLKAYGMTKEECAIVLDSLISRGIYEETYRHGKLLFKLRTRTAADSDRLVEMIQEFSPNTAGVLQHLIARVNLASSLSCYADNIFSFTEPTDSNREVLDSEFTERYKFVAKLPQVIFLAMTDVLERFDRRVLLAGDARSLENF
jgi:hypothetical protein